MDIDLKDVVETAGAVDELRPVVNLVIDALAKMEPEIMRVVGAVSDKVVDTTVRMINRYQANGFTLEQAMFLVTSNKLNIGQGLQNSVKTKSK